MAYIATLYENPVRCRSDQGTSEPHANILFYKLVRQNRCQRVHQCLLKNDVHADVPDGYRERCQFSN